MIGLQNNESLEMPRFNVVHCQGSEAPLEPAHAESHEYPDNCARFINQPP
jgi:hypothetical protein